MATLLQKLKKHYKKIPKHLILTHDKIRGEITFTYLKYQHNNKYKTIQSKQLLLFKST